MNLSFSFEAPQVVNEFILFLVRKTFVDDYMREGKLTGLDLVSGFKRTGVFSIEAPVEKWKKLFLYLDQMEDFEFSTRSGMIIFSLYVNVKNMDEFSDLVIKDRSPLEDDPILEKKRLFEACMRLVVKTTLK